MREDDARNRMDHGPDNIVVLRRRARDVVARDKSKGSLAVKLKRAGWDEDFLIGSSCLITCDSPGWPPRLPHTSRGELVLLLSVQPRQPAEEILDGRDVDGRDVHAPFVAILDPIMELSPFIVPIYPASAWECRGISPRSHWPLPDGDGCTIAIHIRPKVFQKRAAAHGRRLRRLLTARCEAPTCCPRSPGRGRRRPTASSGSLRGTWRRRGRRRGTGSSCSPRARRWCARSASGRR